MFSNNSITRKCFYLAILLLTCVAWDQLYVCAGVAEETESGGQEWNHIKTVLMSAEYGGRSGVVERWNRSPLITAVGASKTDQAYIESLIMSWNQILAETPIQLKYTNDARADIGIIFADRANFKEISAIYGFQIVEGGVGFAGTIVDNQHHMRMGLVLIDNKLLDHERKATIAQELYHTLGPINDSPYFPASVVFEDETMPSSAIKLADVDRKLLKFLYAYLKPGDLQSDTREAFIKFWDTLE